MNYGSRIAGVTLSAMLLTACGSGSGGLSPAVALTAHARHAASTMFQPHSKLTTCKGLLWCNQLDVVGDVLVSEPQFNFDSCANASAPGCLGNLQSDTDRSSASHSASAGARKAGFSEEAEAGMGGVFHYDSTTSVTVTNNDAIADSGVIISTVAYDTLYPQSKTLPKGSKVKLAVTLTLTPSSTKVDCDANAYSTGELAAYWGLVAKGPINSVSVIGDCEGQTFDYTTADAAGHQQPGTTITGTLMTTIGTSYRFGLGGVVGTSATIECTNNMCPTGLYDSYLTGKWILTIKSMTPNATFKTASGFDYGQ